MCTRCFLYVCAAILIVLAVIIQYALNPAESDDLYCDQLTPDIVKPHHQILALSDGRILEYFQFGDTNSNKYLLTIHGVMTEGSVSHRNNKILKQLHLNVISPSIPGWGLSSPSQKPSDIRNDAKTFIELMNHLKVDKFVLAGWSAGGLYALAIASLYPQRITKLGLFVPVSMYYGKCNPFPNPIESNLRYFFGIKYVRDILSMTVSTFIKMKSTNPNMHPMVWNSLKRSFCKSWKGLSIMSEYIISDWSHIDFNAVSTIDKIIISSNLNDTINVPQMQQCLHRLIDGSVLKTFANKTHHDVMNQTQALLTELISL